ncbi:MAG: hypothetical protein JG766_2642, partial [Desulfacinum sp.]|nr:hypothetical protein [Desulfacinum sp.]
MSRRKHGGRFMEKDALELEPIG